MGQAKVEALAVIFSFLAWAERQDPNMMFGSHTVGEAIEAMAALAGVPAEAIRSMAD